MIATRRRVRPLLFLLAGLVLVALSRLPQLLSPWLGLDGDEAVVALMAQHIREGKELPLFFWGQSYGLALPEAATIAAFFAVFGPSVIALKIAILVIWTGGCAALVQSLRVLGGHRAGLIAAALIIFCPAWFAWSLKARGGYQFSFLLSHVVLWIVATLAPGDRRVTLKLVLVGGCLALVWFSQPLWIVPLIPVLVVAAWTRRRWLDAVPLLAGAVGIFGGVWALGRDSGYWSPTVFQTTGILEAARRLPVHVWRHLTGMYYYDVPIDGGPATETAATVWTLLLLGVFAAAFTRRGGNPLVRASALGAAGCLALALFVSPQSFMARYLLPLTGFAVVPISWELARWLEIPRGRRLGYAALAIAVLPGVAAVPEFGRVPLSAMPHASAVPEDEATRRLVSSLLQRGIHHVYTIDPTYQWNVMFASGEKIQARWQDPKDRRPAYALAVDRALLAGEPVALIGDAAEAEVFRDFLRRHGYSHLETLTVADRHFAVLDPPEALVRALGFRLNE